MFLSTRTATPMTKSRKADGSRIVAGRVRTRRKTSWVRSSTSSGERPSARAKKRLTWSEYRSHRASCAQACPARKPSTTSRSNGGASSEEGGTRRNEAGRPMEDIVRGSALSKGERNLLGPPKVEKGTRPASSLRSAAARLSDSSPGPLCRARATPFRKSPRGEHAYDTSAFPPRHALHPGTRACPGLYRQRRLLANWERKGWIGHGEDGIRRSGELGGFHGLGGQRQRLGWRDGDWRVGHGGERGHGDRWCQRGHGRSERRRAPAAPSPDRARISQHRPRSARRRHDARVGRRPGRG